MKPSGNNPHDKVTTTKINETSINPDVLDFVTYCISKLANELGMSQREVYRRLIDSGILYGYIAPSYDVLHTFGSRYLMDDLISFMKEKGALPA